MCLWKGSAEVYSQEIWKVCWQSWGNGGTMISSLLVTKMVSAVPKNSGICNMMSSAWIPYLTFTQGWLHVDFIEPTSALLRTPFDKGMTAEYIWMDNVGENKKLMERALGANWKLTLSGSLWHAALLTKWLGGSWICNYCQLCQAKCVLSCPYGWPNLHLGFKWGTYVQYSTAGNLVMDKDRTLTHYQQVGLKHPKWAESKVMWLFGEVGVVTCGKNVKLGDCGISMLFVGHVENQSSDCYRRWNPTSWKVTDPVT